MTVLPLAFKSLLSAFKRADELDRNSQRENRIVAYHVRSWGVTKAAKLMTKDLEEQKFVAGQLDLLEKLALQLHIAEGEGKTVCIQQATFLFDRADEIDRAGFAEASAKLFYTAATIYDSIEQFGEQDSEIIERKNYAMWRAADIVNSINADLAPISGGFRKLMQQPMEAVSPSASSVGKRPREESSFLDVDGDVEVEEDTSQVKKQGKTEKGEVVEELESQDKEKSTQLTCTTSSTTAPPLALSEKDQKILLLNQKELLHFIQKNYANAKVKTNSFLSHLLNACYDKETRVLTICKEEEEEEEEHDQIIGTIQRFPSQLYVFPEYEILFDLIWKLRTSKNVRDFAIIGNPGIGKTMFGLYVMYRLVHLGITFMYETSSHWIELFLNDVVVLLPRSEVEDLMQETPFREKLFYLTDLMETNREPCSTMFYICGICLTSPNPTDRYKSFIKGDLALVLYMKIPSIEEVKRMKRVLLAHKNLDQDVFQSQLDKFGPIPRLALSKLSPGDTIVLSNAIVANASILACMLRMVSTGELAISGKLDDTSHVFVHMDTVDHRSFFYRPTAFSQCYSKELQKPVTPAAAICDV